MNWIHSSSIRSSGIVTTSPTLPSLSTVTMNPSDTEVPSTSTVLSITATVVEPSGYTNTANTVPWAVATAFGVTTSNRSPASVNDATRLMAIPEVCSPSITVYRASLSRIASTLMVKVVS